jgi:hypothetical protein
MSRLFCFVCLDLTPLLPLESPDEVMCMFFVSQFPDELSQND